VLDLQRALHADPSTTGGRPFGGAEALHLHDIANKVSQCCGKDYAVTAHCIIAAPIFALHRHLDFLFV
jgi:hypothetical protein